MPRDRDGSFDPVVVRKRQRRLDGVDEMVLSLSAKGLATGDIADRFAQVYGQAMSKDTAGSAGPKCDRRDGRVAEPAPGSGAVSSDRCES